MKGAWIVLFVSLVFAPSILHATTYTAATCSQADVAAKVALATHGDTVLIPDGSCIWTTTLTVNVGITLKGQNACTRGTFDGKTNLPSSCPTVITDNVPKPGEGSGRNLIEFYVDAPNALEVAELSLIDLAANEASTTNLGLVMVSGTTSAINIHHLLNNGGGGGVNVVYVQGYVRGVVHHIKMSGSGKPFAMVNHDKWNGGIYGDGSWAAALAPGTSDMMYFEDNWVENTYTSPANFFDGFTGARWVIRYNYFKFGSSTSHGTDSGNRRRSIRWQEVYNNTYNLQGDAIDYIVWIRGGSGVVYNNTIINSGGVNSVAKDTYFRADTFFNPFGICNGSNVYDQNTSGQSGWICVDQPGSGTSKNMNGSGNADGSVAPVGSQYSPASTDAVGNISEPFYVWGNTINGSSNNCGNFGCDSGTHVKLNRDKFSGTARPGYTAYTYPHPLQAGGGASVLTRKINFQTARCEMPTAWTRWSLPSTGRMNPLCRPGGAGGGNVTYGILGAAAGTTSTAYAHFRFPSDFLPTQPVDVMVEYLGSTISSTTNIRTQVAIACVAEGEDTLTLAYNVASADNSSAPATSGARGTVSFPNVNVTSCAPGEQAFLKLERLSGDTYTGETQYLNVELTYRRTEP